jgi:hypothetical protein
MVEKRGKKATADLEVVPLFEIGAKPPPPADMPKLQADVWRSVVDAMPPRWFDRGTFPVLTGLCRHVVAADKIWPRYEKALDDDSDDAERLGRMYRRETAAIERASADLRLTKIARLARTNETERQKFNQPLGKAWEL